METRLARRGILLSTGFVLAGCLQESENPARNDIGRPAYSAFAMPSNIVGYGGQQLNPEKTISGAEDWIHWGLSPSTTGNPTSESRRAGTQASLRIGSLAQLGLVWQRYAPAAGTIPRFIWNNGLPPATSAATPAGRPGRVYSMSGSGPAA